MDENKIISKSDFILYLKYLISVLENENEILKSILDNIKEVIKIESDYTPSVYYYNELLEAFDVIIRKYNNDIIRWTKISDWKTYLRKNKIKKYL